MGQKAIFFDRDGVLNVDTGYVHRIEDVLWIPGARELVGRLTKEGYLLFVVTNQSGIARGYYSEDDVKRLHRDMELEFARFGGKITEYFYCPHLKGAAVKAYDQDCNCRKPKPGMIQKALSRYQLKKADVLLIGDSQRDVEAARNAGIHGYLFQSGDLASFWKHYVSADMEGTTEGGTPYV